MPRLRFASKRVQDDIASEDDRALVEALRRGDEAAFATLVDRYSRPMLRLAATYVRSPAVAEEVVQEAWLGVVAGIDRFEGRSSLKTWIFRILTNTAQTRGAREARSVPFSSLEREGEEEPAVDPDRFGAEGFWASPPRPWDLPDERLLSKETRERVAQTIEALPPMQRAVISLRDVEGWSSEEVRNVLELSETNQRVLLHRARSTVRAELERYFTGA
jgi:RNA polymerase sigma-70 factor (ECF subfamily)